MADRAVSDERTILKRKEVRTMKYEAPELTNLSWAIDAIQSMKESPNTTDSDKHEVGLAAYEDWE
jgi:hypothetical protein